MTLELKSTQRHNCGIRLAWRADWERGKEEIIEAIKALAPAANKQLQLEVPYNDIQAWQPPTTNADEHWTLPLPPEEGSDPADVVSPTLPPVPEILSDQCVQLARAVESSFADTRFPPRSEDPPVGGMSSAKIGRAHV